MNRRTALAVIVICIALPVRAGVDSLALPAIECEADLRAASGVVAHCHVRNATKQVWSVLVDEGSTEGPIEIDQQSYVYAGIGGTRFESVLQLWPDHRGPMPTAELLNPSICITARRIAQRVCIAPSTTLDVSIKLPRDLRQQLENRDWLLRLKLVAAPEADLSELVGVAHECHPVPPGTTRELSIKRDTKNERRLCSDDEFRLATPFQHITSNQFSADMRHNARPHSAK